MFSYRGARTWRVRTRADAIRVSFARSLDIAEPRVALRCFSQLVFSSADAGRPLRGRSTLRALPTDVCAVAAGWLCALSSAGLPVSSFCALCAKNEGRDACFGTPPAQLTSQPFL